MVEHTEQSFRGPPSAPRFNSNTRMQASPGCTGDWKKWMPSSAGVLGLAGLGPDGEREPDFGRLGIEIFLP